jgi:hypothetical protein
VPLRDFDLQRKVSLWLLNDLPDLVANFSSDIIAQQRILCRITATAADEFPILMRVAHDESYVGRFASRGRNGTVG